jgi:hypothetical protein
MTTTITFKAAAKRLGITPEHFKEWCERYHWGRESGIFNDWSVDWELLRKEFSPNGG